MARRSFEITQPEGAAAGVEFIGSSLEALRIGQSQGRTRKGCRRQKQPRSPQLHSHSGTFRVARLRLPRQVDGMPKFIEICASNRPGASNRGGEFAAWTALR